MTATPAATPGSPLVAIIVDTATSFEREILRGAAQYALEAGEWRLYVEEEPGERLPDLRTLGGSGIIASFDDPRVAAAVSQSGLPTVAVGGGGGYHDPATGIPYVGTDEERVAALAVEHLRELGLGSFGFYGTLPAPTTAWSESRGRFFAAMLAAAGLPCQLFTARHGTRAWSQAQAELQAWLAGLPKPVGIMACDDARGRHVIESCRVLGLRVPQDVAVIGVDDNEIICEFTTPTLTSIAQATRLIGYEAARLLDRLMRDGTGDAATVPERLMIPPLGVVPRGSTQTRLVNDPLIGRVLERIQQQGCRGLTVARLGKEIGLSRWTLERRFKAALGHSLHNHIAQTRLAEAQRLIRSTNLPLKTVATRAGFSSLSYMTTHFRRALGLTPGRFRQLEQPPAVRLAGGVPLAPPDDAARS